MNRLNEIKILNFYITPYLYASVERCIQDGSHLISYDTDGYCNLCGHSESLKDILFQIDNFTQET